MRLFAFLLAFLVAFPLSAAPRARTEGGSPAKERPTTTCGGDQSYDALKVTGFYAYPPFSWAEYDKTHYEKTGQKNYTYHGFVVEPLMQSIKDMGVKRLDQMGFPAFEDALKAGKRGQTDIVFTTYYQDDTQSGLDYIYPAYFGNPFVVVSRADKKLKISDTSQLSGMKGVIRVEEGIEPIIRGTLPTDTKIMLVNGPEAAFRALLSGEADFMISSPYAAAAEARRFKVWKDVYIGEEPIKSVKIFAAFSKISRCRKFKDLFAESFSALTADKVAAEARMQRAIDEWANMHKDDPPLEYVKPQAAAPEVPAEPAPVPPEQPRG